MKPLVTALAVLTLMMMSPVFAGASGKMEAFSDWTEQLAEKSPFQYIDISGAIEVEAGYASDYHNHKESDIDLATVELGFDVGFNDWISGFFLLKWEDDENKVFVDEGGIVLGNLEDKGFSLTIGKIYLPFGGYETNLISDPLTLDLGETREGAAIVNLLSGGLYGAVYTFNSAVGKDDDSDVIDAFGATVGFAHEAEGYAVDVSIGWISNLASSGGFSDYLDEEGYDLIDGRTGGVAVSALLSVGDISLIGAYVTALDSRYLKDHHDKPSAWNLEVGYDFELLRRDANVAVSFQGTDEAGFLGLPKNRTAAGVSYALSEHLTLALELSRDRNYSLANGGSGKNAEAVVAQLAFEF